MRACVVVPVQNEESRLPVLITAMADQRNLAGDPLPPRSFETILLLINCRDRSAAVARNLQRQHPQLQLHILEISFAAHEAHVGRARQILFDLASQRFQSLRRMDGLILSTDADSRPAADWIAQNQAEIARGVDGVGGRILLEPNERSVLPFGVRKLFLLDIGYRRALEEMRALFALEAHDPFPRHHQHFGASLAVTASAYEAAGGMPLRRSREDVALYRALLASGGKFRHSHRVRVYTSARADGRADGGLADAITWWNEQAIGSVPVRVESAAGAETRLRDLGRWVAEYPEAIPPAELLETPEPPPAHRSAEIHETLCALRARIEILRSLSLSDRLQFSSRLDDFVVAAC